MRSECENILDNNNTNDADDDALGGPEIDSSSADSQLEK